MVLQQIPPDFSKPGWTDHLAGSPFSVAQGQTLRLSFNVNPATRLLVISFNPAANVGSYSVIGGSSLAILASANAQPVQPLVYIPVTPALDSYVTLNVTAAASGGVVVSVVALEQDFTPFIQASSVIANSSGNSGFVTQGRWISSYASIAIRDANSHVILDTGAYGDVGVVNRAIKINLNLNQPVNFLLGVQTDSGMVLNGGFDFFMDMIQFTLNGGTSQANLVNAQGVWQYGGGLITPTAGTTAFLMDPAERLIMSAQCAIAPVSGALEYVYTRQT